VHAYPTWSIATRLAAASFFGEQNGITARAAAPAPADPAPAGHHAHNSARGQR